MAPKMVLKGKTAYFHGRDVSDIVREIMFSSEIEEKDSTTIGLEARDADPGLERNEVSLNGFLPTPSATDAPDGKMFDSRGQKRIVQWEAEDGSVGSVGHAIGVLGGVFTPGPAAVGELWGFTLELGPKGVPLYRGKVVENGAQYLATGPGNPIELAGGVASGGKLVAALQVLEFDGTTLDAVVESDGDNTFAAAATRITHSQFTGNGAELLTADGPITDTWFRWAWTFTGTSFKAAGLLAVV